MIETDKRAITTQKIYKVSEITRDIRLILESRFPVVWVEGEISNFKLHTSGHMYFTLKDDTAQLTAVCFARSNRFLKFKPKDGLQVICIGRISVYDQRGQYQLYVERMEPKGLGALQLAFIQLKEKLEKEGLFRVERKRPIPLYPKRIGLVTSETGAAIQDMLKVFRRKSFGLHITLYPVRVQGEGAAAEIANAIGHLNQEGQCDVMIVGRGGGSLEDLWAFNEEIAARAIVQSRIPVISAVGHEVDWTIADFVSDLRAHTPTAAAEHLVEHWDGLERKAADLRERMVRAIQVFLATLQEQLRGLAEAYAFRQPLAYLNQYQQRVDDLVKHLSLCMRNLIQEKKSESQHVMAKLGVLSPFSVLERGYSITFDHKGRLLKKAAAVHASDLIQTRLASGTVESKVLKTGA